ncbi:hypothetical protein N9R48_01190 [Rickettsiales bacterium]|nr:hypothetical protein [Rickettsiales bacterium]
MTINQDCLTEKYDDCENSQAQEKNECRNSGDYSAINKCISDADKEFESCKDQAERDCEIQDTTIVRPEDTTPPPKENNATKKPDKPVLEPKTDPCKIIINGDCQKNLDGVIASLASYDNCFSAQDYYNKDQKYDELIKLGVKSTISSDQQNLHLICPVPTQEEKCEIILDCKGTNKELKDALNNLSGSCQDVEETFKDLTNTDILKKNGKLILNKNNSLEYICDKSIETEVDPSKGGGLPIGSIIGIVGSVALVLAGIGFYLNRQQKRKNKDAALPTAMEGEGNGNQTIQDNATNYQLTEPQKAALDYYRLLKEGDKIRKNIDNFDHTDCANMSDDTSEHKNSTSSNSVISEPINHKSINYPNTQFSARKSKGLDSSPNQENTSPTGENRQEDPMGAAGGAAAAEPSSSKDQEDAKLTADFSDITTPPQETKVASHDSRLPQKEQDSTSSPAKAFSFWAKQDQGNAAQRLEKRLNENNTSTANTPSGSPAKPGLAPATRESAAVPRV